MAVRKATEPVRADSWLTLAELARVLDYSEQSSRKLLNHIPEKWVRREKPLRVYGRGAVLIWASRQEGEQAEDAEAVASPALERKREVECQLKLLELATREGELVPRSQMRNLLMGMAAVLRRTGELLVRKFGNDAGEVLQEGIDDMDRLAQAEGFAVADSPQERVDADA